MDNKKGRVAFWTKCLRCEDRVFFFRDENDGCAFFDEPGDPWPKHDCISAEEISAYKNAPARRIEKTRRRIQSSPRKYQNQSRFHTSLFNAPVLQRLTLADRAYVELEITVLGSNSRKVFFPEEHVQALRECQLAEMRVVVMKRGSTELPFASWVAPFFSSDDSHRVLTDLNPSQASLDKPVRISESTIAPPRKRPL